MEKIELLAPAKDLETLKIAISYGADAVYIGGKKFSARESATNFSLQDIKAGLLYAKLFDTKIYVAVNTLIKNNEYKETLDYINRLYQIGIDAVIIQDIGLAKIIKYNFPKLEVHASTQTTIMDSKTIRLLDFFDRYILARELSKDQIKTIIKNTKKKIEIFVHGALCMSFSGQCLMSSIIGGRSGNRGRCAQPCRKRYNGTYLLSTADLCLIDHIPELIKIGVSSLKIEGRLKSKEYVSAIVSIYRKAIDSYYDGAFQVSEKDKKKLLLAFNRSFTDGYYAGNKSITASDSPGNRGLYLGKIENGKIRLEENLKKDDTISIIGTKNKITKKIHLIHKEHQKTEHAKKGDIINFNINYPAKIYKIAEEKAVCIKKAPLSIKIDVRDDKKISINAQTQGYSFNITSEKISLTPKNKHTTKENIKEIFSKVKKSGFEPNDIRINYKDEYFIPFSRLTDLKNQMIKKLYEEITNKNSRDHIEIKTPSIIDTKNDKSQKFYVKIYDMKGIEEATGIADIIYYNIFSKDIDKIMQYAKDKKITLFPEIPRILYDDQIEWVINKIRQLDPTGLKLGTPALINIFKNKTIHLDQSFNIFNDYSLDFWKKKAIISPELNLEEIKNFKNKNFIVYVHGNLIVMNIKQNLIAKNLTDDTGHTFEIRKNPANYTELLNSRTTALFENILKLKKAGINEYYFDLDTDVSQTLNTYKCILDNRPHKIPKGQFTYGHLNRGIL